MIRTDQDVMRELVQDPEPFHQIRRPVIVECFGKAVGIGTVVPHVDEGDLFLPFREERDIIFAHSPERGGTECDAGIALCGQRPPSPVSLAE